MNLPKIVCPHNKSLLRNLSGCTIAVRVNRSGNAAAAAANVRSSGNDLFCVIIEGDSPLDEIEFQENLKGIPLAVMANSPGKFRNLAKHIKTMRDLNLRVYLPANTQENITGLRVLSSMGIHGCAVLRNGETDWEALTDLMTYAVLESMPHASVEPFAFIASHYDPFSYLEWGSVWFDDPKHFLHLDAKGRVALSRAELGKKRFIAASISEIAVADDFPAIRGRIEAWRRYFTEGHPCASCGGWKVCLGKLSEGLPEDKGCSAFFMEMIEVSRQYKAHSIKAEECRIWQL